MAVVTDQPQQTTVAKELFQSGPVSIRTLTDTQEDSDFVGRVTIEAFRGKITHAAKESSLPMLIDYQRRHCRGRQQEFYERYLIAEYNGVKAGVCCLRYNGDNDKFPQRDDDMPSGLGVGDKCGLGLLLLMDASVDKAPLGYCYVDHICVDDGFRGKGIGKIILDFAEEEAKRNGCRHMYLWVMSDNPAQRLYFRQGYNITETNTGYGCGLKCASGTWKQARMEKQLS